MRLGRRVSEGLGGRQGGGRGWPAGWFSLFLLGDLVTSLEDVWSVSAHCSCDMVRIVVNRYRVCSQLQPRVVCGVRALRVSHCHLLLWSSSRIVLHFRMSYY